MSPSPPPPAAKRHRLPPPPTPPPHQPLLPGLPDDLASLCLSRVPPPLLYRVCRRWRRLLYSPSFPPFLALYALLSNNLITTSTTSTTTNSSNNPNNLLHLYAYDPLASTWHALPSPPPPHPVLRHPSVLSRVLPLRSLATSGLLLLLAASSPQLLPALARPLAFHPPSSAWRALPALERPRRWCAAAALRDRVFLFSGLSGDYSSDVARSAERLDTAPIGAWRRLASLRDSRFCREPAEAVAARGRAYVAIAGAREGAAYDVERDRWEEAPPGMLEGWTGPAAADAEGRLFAVAAKDGAVREYSWGEDAWREVARGEELRGAVQAAAAGGRLCAVVAEGRRVAVVDVGNGKGKGRVWAVEPPAGKQVVAVHVLPRPSCIVR